MAKLAGRRWWGAAMMPAEKRQALIVQPGARSHRGGGPHVAANARTMAMILLGRRSIGEPRRQTPFATVGRPWLGREPGECAFVVAGDGEWVLSCRAPGKSPHRGWASYCEAHAGALKAPRSMAVSE